MVLLAVGLHSVSAAKLPSKQCQLVRELFKRSEECFLEPECGEECETKQDRECRIEEERQCNTVQEEQCDTIQVYHNIHTP